MPIQSRRDTPLAKYIDDVMQEKRMFEKGGEVFRTRGDLARAIGMSDSTFSRSVKSDGKLTVEQCLRLAAVTRDDPARILAYSQHDVLAKLVARLWKRDDSRLTHKEQEHIERWRRATPSEQLFHDALLDAAEARATIAVSSRTSHVMRRKLAHDRAVAHARRRVETRR